MKYNFMDAKDGTRLENFYPAGWDIRRINEIMSRGKEAFAVRESWWNDDFELEPALSRDDWMVKVGFRMALEILKAKERGEKLAVLLPITPVSMYYWCVKFIKEWKLKCDHVYGFAMADWCDADGNAAGEGKVILEKFFYGPLGEYTVPTAQREYATKEDLPDYEGKLDQIHKEGGRVLLVYSIGRDMNIAFWEPHWAADYGSEGELLNDSFRIAGKLHPLTILEQSMNTFNGNFMACPARANTISIGLAKKADFAIGGAWCELRMNQRWQTLGIWCGLHYGPDMWAPASYIPTIPGVIYYTEQQADTEIPENPYIPFFAKEEA